MGFFGNISRTLSMMKASANVLQKDKELVLFPLLAAACIAIFLALMWSFGAIGLDNTEEEGQPIAVYVVIVFVNCFH